MLFPKKKWLNKEAKKTSPEIKYWKYFSIMIRLRDTDKYGFGHCISCGRQVSYRHDLKSGDAGHFINRGAAPSIKYHEKNVNMQCRHCNSFQEGNAAGYAIGIVKKYGKGIIEELQVLRRGRGYRTFELDVLVENWKFEIRRLKKTKEPGVIS